jgi:hypothetical protein
MSKRNNAKRREKSIVAKAEIFETSETQASEYTANSDEIRQIFFGKDSEELTDKLIDELVTKGWEREGLINFQREGFRYNRSRNSLIEGEFHSF